MVPLSVCLRDWDWWGNFLYLIGSIGYGVMDFSAGWCTDGPFPKFIDDDVATILWIAVAVVFVFDSLLYGMGWLSYAWQYSKLTNTPIPLESRFWAEFYNIACSLGYVALACLPFQLSDEPTLGETISYSMETVGITLICVTLFLVDSLLYFVAWRSDYYWEISQAGYPSRKKRRCGMVQRTSFWAELFNVIPSLIYVAGTAHLFIMYMRLLSYLPGEPPVHATTNTTSFVMLGCNRSLLSNSTLNASQQPLSIYEFPPDTQQEASDYRTDFAAADNFSSRWFFFADILFVIDSILYMIAWYKDNQPEDPASVNVREQSINSSFRRLDDSSILVDDDVSSAAGN